MSLALNLFLSILRFFSLSRYIRLSHLRKSATTMATKKSVGDLKEADLKGKKVFVRVI
ncbi:Phosphoglycerate kinase, cytosolic [Gossypium arboreum]|uniref:Phosphoglycerate kinase, cytosolic n=1 Tax=Gossypium arboreum TaxID=29729 RepID=A0A0B0P1U1_GOSAR|nr:Phosphoglycerate kinase, cytosolic [Gossypium arboreum]